MVLDINMFQILNIIKIIIKKNLLNKINLKLVNHNYKKMKMNNN